MRRPGHRGSQGLGVATVVGLLAVLAAVPPPATVYGRIRGVRIRY